MSVCVPDIGVHCPTFYWLVLYTLNCTGMPLQAVTTQMRNRVGILSAITAAQCYVNKGRSTEERGDEILDEYVQENPRLKTAYAWAVNSSNPRAAVEAMVSYLGADCSGSVTDEIMETCCSLTRSRQLPARVVACL